MSYASLHDRLRTDVVKVLKKELGVDNVHALPHIQKMVVNVGINKTKMDSKEMHEYIGDILKRITGQKPVFRKTRKAISNFKTREGSVVGAMVTLRGHCMEAFLDRLLSYVLPRIRDFRGLPTKLDGHGNYAIGLKDHTIFPEVPSVDAAKIFGLQIQITTTAGDDTRGRALLKAIGMPFTPERPASARQSKSTAEQASSSAEATGDKAAGKEGGSQDKAIEESASVSDT
ncbi:MAG: large subunit ribosomal protein L5 [Candidatus Peregrinibacteria bacterium Greene0416_19]|nr:MAG: large subunit ribosomal protein L5 [Candidatus Peregrinibacteria bacterium Greene0416_19]